MPNEYGYLRYENHSEKEVYASFAAMLAIKGLSD